MLVYTPPLYRISPEENRKTIRGNARNCSTANRVRVCVHGYVKVRDDDIPSYSLAFIACIRRVPDMRFLSPTRELCVNVLCIIAKVENSRAFEFVWAFSPRSGPFTFLLLLLLLFFSRYRYSHYRNIHHKDMLETPKTKIHTLNIVWRFILVELLRAPAVWMLSFLESRDYDAWSYPITGSRCCDLQSVCACLWFEIHCHWSKVNGFGGGGEGSSLINDSISKKIIRVPYFHSQVDFRHNSCALYLFINSFYPEFTLKSIKKKKKNYLFNWNSENLFAPRMKNPIYIPIQSDRWDAIWRRVGVQNAWRIAIRIKKKNRHLQISNKIRVHTGIADPAFYSSRFFFFFFNLLQT